MLVRIFKRDKEIDVYGNFVIKAIISYSIVYLLIWIYKVLVYSQKAITYDIVKPFASLLRTWNIHEKFGQSILKLSGITLSWFDYTTELDGLILKIAGLVGVRMHFPCMGFEVMAAFLCLFFSYNDKISRKKKIGYALIILLLINILNVIRIDLLLLNDIYRIPLYFDHHDVFNFIIYILIIISFYMWTLIAEKHHLRYRDRNLEYSTT